MQHTAKSTFQNALTGTDDIKSEFTSTGVKYLSNQISNYDDAALLNPWYLVRGVTRFVLDQVTDRSTLFELFTYSAVFTVVIAVELLFEGHQFDLSDNKRSLVEKLSTLSYFLLAFYIGLAMTRWWRLRTDGVGGIWSANNTIAPLLGVIYHSTKRGSPSLAGGVLSAMKRIRRYSAASLYYFFLKSGQKGFDEDGLLRLGLLTQTELQTVQSLPIRLGTQSEYLWAVIGTECGKITDTMFLNDCHSKVWTDQLAALWMKGRSGAGLIAAQIGCPVLYDYAALVSLLVKMSNMANFWVHAVQAVNHNNIVLDSARWQESLMTYFIELVPLLFYALVLDAMVTFAVRTTTPFDDDGTSFPGYQYVNCMLEDFDVLCNVNFKNERVPMTPLHGDSGAGFLANV